MDYGNLTVVIPTLNEARNISELLKILAARYRGIKVVVADDGSKDGTKEAVARIAAKNRNVKLLDRSKSSVHGLTASVIDAVKQAETGFILVMDGDLQHPPEKAEEIAEKLRSDKELVIGTRRRVAGKWPWERRLMSIIATNLARLRLMSAVEDPMSGFFGVRRKLFAEVLERDERKFEKEGYKVLFDFLKYAGKVETGKVYYDFGERKGGKSKIRMKHIIIMARSLFR